MASKTSLVTILLPILSIVVAVAGFTAELTRVKTSDVKVEYYGVHEVTCEYPSSPSMGLALAAAATLVLARIIIIMSTTDRCSSCCRTIPNLPIIVRVCFAISWITSCVAIFLFLWGGKLSSKKGVEMQADGYKHYCYIAKPGIFMVAGIMGLMGVLLSLVYYNAYVSAANGAAKTPEVELELEAPPISNVKKQQISDGKKPPINNDKKPRIPLQKH